MKERSLYKKITNLSDWNLNPGCRRKHNLKLKLCRGARKKLGIYNPET